MSIIFCITSIRERLPSAENLQDDIQQYKKQKNNDNTIENNEVNVEIRNINKSPSPEKTTTPKQQTYLINSENESTTSSQQYSKMRKKLEFN